MLETLVELAVVALWGAVLFVHGRRLLRMTLAVSYNTPRRLRHRLERAWWWLGREEFWREVQNDGLRCAQLTLMLFLFALNV